MKIKEVINELVVNNVADNIEFYRELLGFELIATEEVDGYVEWAKMRLGNFLLSFKDEKKVKNEVDTFKGRNIGGTFSICFQIEDIRGFYQKLENNPIVLKALHISPCGMTEFTITDINGYLLTFDELEK